MPQNYQRVLDATLAQIEQSGKTPRLLLHSCCGPCSTYVLEYLTQYFDVTVDYYNPNIYPQAEFEKRLAEQSRVLHEVPLSRAVTLLPAVYEAEVFDTAVQGLEDEPEGGARCAVCYRLRLEHTARLAREGGFDYFTTTLTVSPYKHAETLNQIGIELGERVGVPYLCSDFKKREGYKRSCTLSAQYGIYRQDYCGCRYSLPAE